MSTEAGEVHKGRELRCGHILPKELKRLNVLESFRSEIHEYLRVNGKVRLHKYFHHLNSSQAFALNLFFPFFEGGPEASSALTRALGSSGSVTSWIPEHVPDAAEGTNVDVSWLNDQGNWTHCEVKLSEQEFGKAKPDARHLDKLRGIYGPVLQPYCPAALLEPQAFFGYYQILRNVWLAARDPKASVVFLLPTDNETLWIPLREVVSSLAPTLQRRVHMTSMEAVFATLGVDKKCPAKMVWYAQLLREKYELPEAIL